MSDGTDQPKEELHLDANEAEHEQAAATEQKDAGPVQGEGSSEGSGPIQGEGSGGGSGTSKWAPSTYDNERMLTLDVLKGNAVGEKIEGTLGKVGGPVGSGLAKATAPVGNIVDSAVGGLMRAGDMASSDSGLGKDQDKLVKEDEEFAKPIGGKEQTGSNPLGL